MKTVIEVGRSLNAIVIVEVICNSQSHSILIGNRNSIQ